MSLKCRPISSQSSFRAQFNLYDVDGDGYITRDDLILAFRQQSPETTPEDVDSWADGIMQLYDKDGDGKLERTEFAIFMRARLRKLRDIFDKLDVSRTGLISADDVHEGLNKANVSHVFADVERVLVKLGGGGEHGVDFQTFFDASVLLPEMSSESMLLLGLNASVPMTMPTNTSGTKPWMIVTAGFINGAVSRTACAPTDRLRAVLATGRYSSLSEALQGILKGQGVRGLWASNIANVIQVAPENGIAFGLNELLRDKFCSDPSRPTMPEKFALGSFAGATAMSAVYPMYVVQNRLAASVPGQYSGTGDAIREVMQGGRSAMYAGYCCSLVRVLPLKGIMLGGYSALKDYFKDPQTGHISTLKSLGCSAVSGGIGHAACYPLHLARTVLQQPVPEGGRKYSGLVDVLSERLKTQGIRGCYKGLPIWLCNRIPAVAIEFAVNERALDALRNLQ